MKFDTKEFDKVMRNAIEYSKGFVVGIDSNQINFIKQFAEVVKEGAYKYIDSSARLDPSSLHHVYEWGQAGDPGGRLYQIEYSVGSKNIRFSSSFLESTVPAPNSSTAFFDKARVMESGQSVTIEPISGDVLAFEDNGETVFTTEPVNVENPGGVAVQGSFQSAWREYFENYLEQGFVRSMLQELETPIEFKQGWGKGMNFSTGVNQGKRYATIKGGIS